MSTRINLLPWREEERKRRNIEFSVMAGAGALVAFLLVFTVKLFFDESINYQETRNKFLENELKVLESKLETIKELEKTKENLLSRMNIIQELQSSRPQVVHLFEEVAGSLPDGITVSRILQQGPQVTIQGNAQSNARVSAFMRNLDESPWLQKPVLVSVGFTDKNSNSGDENKEPPFHVTLQQVNPDASSEEDEEL